MIRAIYEIYFYSSFDFYNNKIICIDWTHIWKFKELVQSLTLSV